MLDLELHKRRFLESWEAEQGKRAQDLTQPGSGEDTVWGTFEKIQIIGTGAFGAVVLCKKKHMPDRDKHFAVKVVSMRHVIDSKQVPNLINEKRILSSLNYQEAHPFIVQLQSQYCYKDNTFLYMALEYVQGGEMFSYINSHGQLSESQARFYAAQVLLVFRYLHGMGIIYRDLKPENLLIDRDGYIKVTDFGFAKKLNRGSVPQRKSKDDTVSYAIPSGGLFGYVTMPHYFCELIAWLGLACVTQQLNAFLTLADMTSYLAGRSAATTRWYKSKFPNYPPERKNLIPFLF